MKAAPPPPPPRAASEPTVIAPATDEQVAAALGIPPELARELREKLQVVHHVSRVNRDRPFSPLRIAAMGDASMMFERILAHLLTRVSGEE